MIIMTSETIYVRTSYVPKRNNYLITVNNVYKATKVGTLIHNFTGNTGNIISIIVNPHIGCAFLDYRTWEVIAEEDI